MTALRAELIKLGTLPALRLTALATWAATALLAFASGAAARPDGPAGADLVRTPLGWTQAGFVILGALASASEYQGGQICTALTAVPRRFALQGAKTLALAVAAVPVAAVAVAVSVAVSGAAPADVLGTAAAATAYLTLTTLLSSAAATLVRRPVPAAGAVLGCHLVAGPLLSARTAYDAYLPDTAALDPARGTAATVVWTLAAVGVAAVTFHCRDA
ncbi:hypothetical protein [Jidongwangia harbinensis]|uniref:hypothetical protein n=1 Tax=Jidongwangia harbinensis TaxID=2878561 RepID=UPI001CD989CB|nr:hypothetical protein [Jidongwangia harbinensis]MCA2219160.1 hypothetical protein [Jidongwangia harbinensis]